MTLEGERPTNSTTTGTSASHGINETAALDCQHYLHEKLFNMSDYHFVGTRNRWRVGEAMEPEGDNQYGFTVVLGVNRWEHFQIWPGGHCEQRLFPEAKRAPWGSPVLMNTDGRCGFSHNWLLDGRGGPPGEAGRPGDKYRVHFRSVGDQWRVAWEKLPIRAKNIPIVVVDNKYLFGQNWTRWEPVSMLRALQEATDVTVIPAGTYYVVGECTGWKPVEMLWDVQCPSRAYRHVQAGSWVSGFKILRDNDWEQVFCPSNS